MRILLLQPNYDAHIVHPPLGLGYLASFLKTKGHHQVLIFDGTLKNASLNDFLTAISKFKADLVGISVLSRGHKQAKKITKALKQRYKKLPLVLGGTQITALPKKILQSWAADFVIIGEGEVTFLELAAKLEKNKNNFSKVPGLGFKDSSGKIVITPPRPLIKDLDSLPFPAWNLIHPKKYRIVPILQPAKDFPIAPILTSRGCPFNCSFCASNITWKRQIRFRSPENVLREIKLLKKRFGVKEIHFCDDNFTMDIKRAKKICQMMISEKINLPWQCPNGVRIDRLPLSLLRLMKKAGCYALGLGIESGNQKVLDKNNKHLNLKIVPKVLKNLNKVGIESYGFFILGLPGDSRKRIEETINFALKNPFDRAWFNIFTPYPGSAAFSNWLKNKDFNKIDWNKHDCSSAVISVPKISSKELEKIQKKALLKFYLRPKIILKLANSIGIEEITTFLMTRFFSKLLKPVFLLVHKIIRRRKLLLEN
ncbi:hypothetical protein COT75_04985 [Candidatus Beckwithbacteria bacterium CG10_big_fil_rev_8_21_14_0_10_34_10]|uniref:Uncharacterized protein n=1 Tax=Candidatus Beckwithbacteria bacterium CG10_big_fil_rev_8_21_14_0_10_34_10 TaxID=1974495 RepID=A0A2H0W8B2_9BACT|nr:MAG: hypothetical protein COT75_04985 [Candidatus Beckwithbacteria bacterium CG10_big_fil_rev_8_21_14_0_10_34_10]